LLAAAPPTVPVDGTNSQHTHAKKRHDVVAVTVDGEAVMPDRPRQVGVCIVRAQVQGDYLRITVTSNPNVTRTLRSTDVGIRMDFADVDLAVDAVAQFLRTFEDRLGEERS
jgi:hypothetical protein